jgi:hypothetical protein
VVRNARVTDVSPTRSGGDKHLSFRLTDGIQNYSLTAFNLASRYSEVGPIMDLAMVYDGSRWGPRDPGWKLLDFQPPGRIPCPWSADWRPGGVALGADAAGAPRPASPAGGGM